MKASKIGFAVAILLTLTACQDEASLAPRTAAPAEISEVNPLPAPTTEEQAANFQIIGGTDTTEPLFFASLIFADSGERFCGGSFIDSHIVVTAAHCVYDLPANRIMIRKAIPDEKRAVTFPVNYITVHREFDIDTMRNDIALIFLRNSAHTQNHDNHYSKAINLNSDQTFPAEISSEKLQAVGYGNTTNFGRKFIATMQQVSLPLVGIQECHDLYDNLFGLIDHSQVCAGDTKVGGIDTCQGDSGGPLFYVNQDGTPLLVGLVSYGQGCAHRNFPGVYTRISHFMPWIAAELRNGHKIPEETPRNEMADLVTHYCGHDYEYTQTLSGEDLAYSYQLDELQLTRRLTALGPWQRAGQAPTALPGHGKQEYTRLCQVQMSDGAVLSLTAIAHAATNGDTSYRLWLALRREDQLTHWLANARAKLEAVALTGSPQNTGGERVTFRHEVTRGLYHINDTLLVARGAIPDGGPTGSLLMELSDAGLMYRLYEQGQGSSAPYSVEYRAPRGQIRGFTLTPERRQDEEPDQLLSLRRRATNDLSGNLSLVNRADYPVYNWTLNCNKSFLLTDENGARYTAELDGDTGHYATDFSRSPRYATLPPSSTTVFTYTLLPEGPETSANTMSCRINGQAVPLDATP